MNSKYYSINSYPFLEVNKASYTTGFFIIAYQHTQRSLADSGATWTGLEKLNDSCKKLENGQVGLLKTRAASSSSDGRDEMFCDTKGPLVGMFG